MDLPALRKRDIDQTQGERQQNQQTESQGGTPIGGDTGCRQRRICHSRDLPLIIFKNSTLSKRLLTDKLSPQIAANRILPKEEMKEKS
jgi:hypothetical protein